MILYTEDAKESTKNLLELINELDKVARHKTNKQKSIIFLYISNEQSESEIKEMTQFTTASKITKYFRINFLKRNVKHIL